METLVGCRSDGQGQDNNDHDIHLRAQRAAERVALKRGWTIADKVRETNIEQVNRDCIETLESMPSWSWDGYVAGLRSRGYEFWELRDSRQILRGYVLKKGNARYKASELGKGRNLMTGKLESTWKNLHAVSPAARQIPSATVITPPAPAPAQERVPLRVQGEAVRPYTGYRAGTTSYPAQRMAVEAARQFRRVPRRLHCADCPCLP